MELLELKSIWDAVVDETISQEKVDEFVVEKSIKKDSKSVLGKIKRVMYFKFIFGGLTLVGSIVMLIGSFITPEKFTFLENIFDIIDNRIFLANVFLFMSAMLSWNFRAFREIQNFQMRPINVKLSLARFIGIMGQAIKLNVYSSVVFNSIALGWMCYLVNNYKRFVEGTLQISFLVIGVVSISAFIFYFLSRFEQKMKFGNYLNQLRSNFKDLEEK